MAWCHQASSHYLNQWRPRSISPYGIARPQRVNIMDVQLGSGCYRNMMSSNGNIFRITGHCAGNSPVAGEFPPQRPVTRSFDVFFDLYVNKRLSKQSWGLWFETPSRSYDLNVMNMPDCHSHLAAMMFHIYSFKVALVMLLIWWSVSIEYYRMIPPVILPWWYEVMHQ